MWRTCVDLPAWATGSASHAQRLQVLAERRRVGASPSKRLTCGTHHAARDTLTVEEVGQLVRKWFPPRKRVATAGVATVVSVPAADVRPVFDIAVTDESVTAAWSGDERRRLDLEHVAVVFERASGLVSVFGPFVGPVQASVFADRYALEIAEMAVGGTSVFVAPLDPGE